MINIQSWATAIKARIQSVANELRQRKRKHAVYFEQPEKSTKEMIVANTFFCRAESQLGCYLTNIQEGPDPPDVVVETSCGEVWGLEVCELVNQNAIHALISNDPLYAQQIAEWKDCVVHKIQEITQRKETLCQSVVGDYQRLVLLLHTDEPSPRSDELEELLLNHDWQYSSVFNSAFVLCGPSGHKADLRVIELWSR